MPTTFNPYSEWLGIDHRITRPNYYQLLGIEDMESDPRVITAAAERTASRLRSCRPGDHAAVWARLFDEISTAKKCLTDPAKKQEYDRKRSSKKKSKSRSDPQVVPSPIDPNLYPPGALPVTAEKKQPKPVGSSIAPAHDRGPSASGSSNAPIPVPSPFDPQSPYSPSQPATASPLPAELALPMAPLSTIPTGVPYLQPIDSPGMPVDPMAPIKFLPNQPPTTTQPPPVIEQAIGPPVPAPDIKEFAKADEIGEPLPLEVSPVFSKKKSRNSLAFPILFGLTGGLALLLVFLAVQHFASQEDNQNTNALAHSSNGASPGPEVPANETDPTAPTATSPAVVDSTEQDQTDDQDLALKPGSSNEQASNADTDVLLNPQDSTMPEPRVSSDSDSVPLPKPLEANSPSMPPSAPTTKPTEAMPASSPVSETITEPQQPKMSSQQLARLGKAMQKARDAIADREFDLANEFLVLAEEMSQLPEHAAKIERLKLLLSLVQQYHEAIVTSIVKLEPGATFEVGETMVVVVEAGRDKLVIRAAGQSRSYFTYELPSSLATVLAEQTLTERDPANLTLKAAYLLANPRAAQVDLGNVRALLEEAAASNDNAKALLPILEDSYDLSQDAKEDR